MHFVVGLTYFFNLYWVGMNRFMEWAANIGEIEVTGGILWIFNLFMA